MLKKGVSMMAAAIMLASSFTSAASAASSKAIQPSAASSGHYEIYPLPQKQTYSGTSFTITDQVNVVIEPTVDESTRNFLNDILASKSLQAAQSAAVVPDKTNIIVGTRDSVGYADEYFDAKIPYDAATFSENDAYVLAIDKNLESKGTIAVLGLNTDAAYYGLATLQMILDQLPGKEIKSVQFEDYADGKWRGFIEGFYGFPWSHEDRISLMRFGGKFKMNSYIFAPKDDKYHNSSWRTLYPADELAKVKELVDVGRESKTQFVWAIHPGFSMINWNNYNAELQTLLAKLEQLYSVGVRQFGLFMDDISTAQSLTDKDKHVKLITDVANWASSKGDVRPLIYCPPFYNQSWTGEGGKPYLQALANVPANVEIMWTGKSVVSSVNTTDNQWPKNAHGRDPYIWLNWPVNDYKDARLMLGKGEVLVPGTHNFSGVVSNPMGQAELSKIALFAVADYTWNVDDFNDERSWLDSFKYVAPDAATDLNTIAYHLSDVSPSGHGLQLGESENIRATLESFKNKFSKGEAISQTGSELISEFDKVISAIGAFRAKSQNANMVDEINPWLNSLGNVAQSGKYAVQSAIALENNQLGTAWEELAKATHAMSESKKFKIKKLNYPDVTVEAGAKRLVPFANELIQKLDAKVYTAIDPDYVAPIAMSSYGSPSNIGNMIDGDKNTNVYFQVLQKNGDWYGVDFGKTIKVRDVEIIQGRNDTDHDIFQRGMLEVSIDGQQWTAIGEERSGFKVTADGLDADARYVRYRLTHAGIPGGKPDLWTAIREFTVNKNRGKVSVYTNVNELTGTAVTATEVSAQLANVSNITLQPGQYIGIKLPALERIAEIRQVSTSSEAVLESSENGVEWQAVSAGNSYPDAAYVRLINKTDGNLTFDLTELYVKLNKFASPVVTHNYGSIYQGRLDDVYNGKLDAKVWFGSAQSSGKYVQVDLGGIIQVQNVAVAINDGEGDYFRQGNLQLSLDGTTWETIHTFSNPEDRSLNFPQHEVPYRFKRVQVDSKPARYVRLISTQNHGSWLALNEIIVNEGQERPGSVNPALTVSPIGELGREASGAIDRKLSTYYMPQGDPKPGSLSYKFSQHTELGQVIILQGPSAISNAQVSIRDEQGWHQAGTLNQSFNAIDTSRYAHVLEVKLVWDGAVKPSIYEIVPVKRDGGVVTPQELTTELTGASIVASGEQFDIQLGLRNVVDHVYAQDIHIDYDVNTMEFVSAKSVKEGIQLVATAADTPGKIRLLIVSEGAANAVSGDAQLIGLTFRAKALTESATGLISVVDAIAADGEGVEEKAAASSISVQITAKPAGIPGDVNNDERVSIGDLAIIAANYGKTSSSPDWQQVKKADVTGDGVIDLDDLVLVARKIVE